MDQKNLRLRIILVGCFLFLCASLAVGQINTVQLSGSVLDPQGATVANAQITAANLATGATSSATSDANGHYIIVGLPPGHYSLTVEAKGFAKLVNPDLTLTLGVAAVVSPQLKVAGGEQSVTVTGQPDLVQTERSDVSQSVTQVQIENLPINGRNYFNFTLLDSQANRDSAPSIGAAPTSGLNFGGQRARSNEVSVDGADAVDNSVNGVRATVSQEAVQEFQIMTSNYMPEFGRATGAVINIVTKSGSNETHGDLFAYLRHSSLQARNPFSVQVNPLTGAVTAVKQPFTRVQTGLTLGGPIQKDKSFYFFSYETTRRQETGFTDIGDSTGASCPTGSTTTLFGLCSATYPFFPAPLSLSAPQVTFVQSLLASGNPQLQALAGQYAVLAGSASSVATSSLDFGAVATANEPPASTPIPPGAQFPIPIDCTLATSTSPGNCGASNVVPLPASFVPLNALIGNYPIKEGTSLWSLRLDHIWNSQNSTFLRANVSPSLVTGIQVNAQNQNFGENAASRTSLQQTRDLAIAGQHATSLRSNLFNEFRYQFARRGLHYGFSQAPGGSNIAVNITGFAFFGREPFSTVDRIEKRNQFTDDLTWVKSNHTFKFGEDTNYIQLGTSKPEIFELNFGGLFDFGSLGASHFGFPSSVAGFTVPSLTALQTYGLGLPGDYIQGIGNSNRTFNVPSTGFFAQDAWRIVPRFTLNYGVRYDIEWMPTFAAGTPLNAAAGKALNVVQGVPFSGKNVAPRLGFAWDPTGSGKTAIRGSYGLFYDHPLLAVAFDSNTADGALSSQLVSGGGTPTRCAITTALCPSGTPGFEALNGGSIFQGVLNTGGVPGISYLANQQRFDPLNSPFFNNQNFISAGLPVAILPFTLPTAGNFVYGRAQQGNLTVERELAHDWKIDLSYSYTHGTHLNRPHNINTSNPTLLMANLANSLAAGIVPSSPFTVAAPPSNVTAGAGNCGVDVTTPPGTPGVLGFLTGCPAPFAALDGQPLGTSAVFNFFRPSGPNPSFATAAAPPGTPCGTAIGGLQTLAGFAGYPAGQAGLCVPWSDVLQQESSGSSVYHGLTVSVTKRFANHMQIFSNYTWSHAIDDSTDLQTLLAPQDNNLPQLERSSSSFDQRHRWVTSAVFMSPYSGSGNWYQKLMANFTFSPIIELSSGRPFTVLTGTDFNLDFGAETDRPSVIRAGPGITLPAGFVTSPFIPNAAFGPPASQCPALSPTQSAIITAAQLSFLGCVGNLGRNAFVRPGFFSLDMQLSRKINLNERWNLEVIAEGFNMLNRFNAADVNPLCDPTSGSCSTTGAPTAALDPRQFQFALKLHF
ncbi:MAG TPA: TonB-dependent receptor [Candidatus Acidoferrales bacterium]|nr:TonB-dependent receptor [Candidatus Acidoferrales bacterium]